MKIFISTVLVMICSVSLASDKDDVLRSLNRLQSKILSSSSTTDYSSILNRLESIEKSLDKKSTDADQFTCVKKFGGFKVYSSLMGKAIGDAMESFDCHRVKEGSRNNLVCKKVFAGYQLFDSTNEANLGERSNTLNECLEIVRTSGHHLVCKKVFAGFELYDRRSKKSISERFNTLKQCSKSL